MSSTDIYVWINHKYKNNVFNKLPMIIWSYLIAHPEKVSWYLDEEINLEELLDYLSKQTITKEVSIIDLIINFVEK